MVELKRAFTRTCDRMTALRAGSHPQPNVVTLPRCGLTFLLIMCKRICSKEPFTSNWGDAVGIPMLRASKDRCLDFTCRPKWLASLVCKLLDRIVISRLVWMLKRILRLPTQQFLHKPSCNSEGSGKTGFPKKSASSGSLFCSLRKTITQPGYTVVWNNPSLELQEINCRISYTRSCLKGKFDSNLLKNSPYKTDFNLSATEPQVQLIINGLSLWSEGNCFRQRKKICIYFSTLRGISSQPLYGQKPPTICRDS